MEVDISKVIISENRDMEVNISQGMVSQNRDEVDISQAVRTGMWKLTSVRPW